MRENTYATKTIRLVSRITKFVFKKVSNFEANYRKKKMKTTKTFQLVQFFGVISNVIQILEVAYYMIRGSLSPRHGASSGCGWRNGLQYGGKLRIHSISIREQPEKGGPPAWGLGEVLTTPHRKSWPSCETDTFASSMD
jgi:hypothetical protein